MTETESAFETFSCASCKWWRSFGDEEQGHCHRNAPSPYNSFGFGDKEAIAARREAPEAFFQSVSKTYNTFAEWPLTLAEMFCGEHVPNNEGINP